MTYLASYIIIWVKGLFHSDWLGASLAVSPIGPQLGEGEIGQSSNPAPPHYR
jgi:hypothetical protein